MNVLKYKGYAATVEFDAEDRILVGHVVAVPQAGGFHAENVDGLEATFHETIDHYLEICERRQVAPQRPFSGNLTVRIEPSLHAAAARAAQARHTSINKIVRDSLVQYLHV